MRQATVKANGIEFSYIEEGEGPLVLLLHGFPDNARTWSSQIPAVAEAGYRAVAPFLRGYPPTEIPDHAAYDPQTHAEDAVALIQALSDEPAFIVGHDWGATATYATIASQPNCVRRACILAASHPRTLLSTFQSPELIHHLFHVWFFLVENFAEDAVRSNDFALIDYLWKHWSPGHNDEEHIADVKKTLSGPGALQPLLDYYRTLVRLPLDQPEFVQRAVQQVDRPVLTIFGGNDAARALADGQEECFTGPYRFEVLDGAGHFVHRERPEEVTRLILDWFGKE